MPATVLRVYEPLEAFPEQDRRRWAHHVDREDATILAEEAERRVAWLQVVRGRVPWRPDPVPGSAAAGAAPHAGAGPLPVGGSPVDGGPVVGNPAGEGWSEGADGHVRVLRIGRARLVCPVGRAPGEETPHRSLVRAWELPLPWLVLVDHTDRAPGGSPGRYLVPMAAARARAARALKTLRRGLGEVEVTAETELVARWLEAFHPRAVVELDGRSVAALVEGEDGASDVQLGLACLAEGDTTGAAAAYSRLMRRSVRLAGISRSC